MNTISPNDFFSWYFQIKRMTTLNFVQPPQFFIRTASADIAAILTKPVEYTQVDDLSTIEVGQDDLLINDILA